MTLGMSEDAGALFARLVEVMCTLRGPHGCPWDREQTLESLRPFVLEETYELLDALDRGDAGALREELGDVLFEAVFLAQIAAEQGHFTISDVLRAITGKLIRRHPHVFTAEGQPLGAAHETLTSSTVVQRWEELKARERDQANAADEKTILAGVPRTLPALLRAYELGSRAAAVGFDWTRPEDVLHKIEEEVAELRAAATAVDGRERLEEELGDALFALANLARHLGIEPEAALRRANDKFQRRFDAMERRARDAGRRLGDLTLDEMDMLWVAEKQRETS
jgi:MazG family protein